MNRKNLSGVRIKSIFCESSPCYSHISYGQDLSFYQIDDIYKYITPFFVFRCCLSNRSGKLQHRITEEFLIGCALHGIRDKAGPVTVVRLYPVFVNPHSNGKLLLYSMPPAPINPQRPLSFCP